MPRNGGYSVFNFRTCMTQAILITFSGIDGAGKTTVAKGLESYLINKNYSVYSAAPLGLFFYNMGLCGLFRDIEQTYIKQTTLEYDSYRKSLNIFFDGYWRSYFSTFAFVDAVHTKIEPELSRNDFVILDKYVKQHLANQAIFGQNLTFFSGLFDGLPKPNISFLIDVSVDTAIERINGRNVNTQPHENEPSLTLLRQSLLSAFQADSEYIILDGSQSPDVVLEQTIGALQSQECLGTRDLSSEVVEFIDSFNV